MQSLPAVPTKLSGLLRPRETPPEVEPDEIDEQGRPTAGRRLKDVAVLALWLAIVVGLPAAFVVQLLREPGPPPAVFTDDDLRAIIVRPEDLPPGFILNHESRSANEDAARYFNDPERARALLDGWQRQGGVGTLMTDQGPPLLRDVVQVATAVERYPDAKHAKLRFDGRGQLFQDWNANPSATRSIKAPRVGDQAAASRMYVTDEAGQELVVYSITLRTGPIVADITTTGLKFKDDEGRQAIQLARLVDERVGGHLHRAARAYEDEGPRTPAGALVRGLDVALEDMRRGMRLMQPPSVQQITAELELIRQKMEALGEILGEP